MIQMQKLAAGLAFFGLAACGLSCSSSHTQNDPASASGQAGAVDGAGNTECTSNRDCSLGVCGEGVCKDVSCVPNSTYCGDGGVWSCALDGTPAVLVQHCSSDQYCLEQSGRASCSATVCYAGDKVCNGSLATQCEPDGSGPKPGGDDCSAAKQICFQGECRDLLCTPGQKLCDDGSVYLCDDAGTTRALVTTCGSSEVCDEAAGACEFKVCDPGKLGCDSNRVVTCNASGSGYVQSGTDCAANNGVCVAGTCVPSACKPSQGFCMGNAAYSCNGSVASLISTCSSDEHCAPSGSYAYCDPDVCQPGELGCNANVLATCNSDGSDWLPGGTDCSLADGTCSNAACVPNACSPGQLFCKDGNVQSCDWQGLTFSLSQFCAVGTYCATSAGVTSCVPTPCAPDSDGCANEKLGHCTSDGMGVEPGATDCAALEQVCTLQGCAKTAVDVISSPAQLSAASAGEFVGDVITVDTGRKLTQIEVDLSMPGTRTLVWSVYVQTNADGEGEFDLKYQKNGSGTGAGYQSSGAINLELEAGKTYAVGVNAADGSVVYYYDVPEQAQALNFAHVIGAVDTGFEPTFDFLPNGPTNTYVARLTTSAP
jgi:hypothetical protein